ncbi:ankyrin repeat domain-containing protein [Paenibacillus solisilvae]|uniref:Ankyrin repeat domain-containing protein n=1 Tax=Paenibacillus solisilvae TaxID=2486751 RepID=A0ABW0W4J8_9BACL
MNISLFRAAEAGKTEEVLQLIAQGADINERDSRGRTPLMAAVHGNKPAAVQAIINAGADINLQDNRQDNPLLYAGAEGLLEILQILIRAGADTRITNRFGGTALIPAADRGHVDNIRVLLEQSDVDIDHINNLGWTALLEAVLLGNGGTKHQEIVSLLLKHGADRNIADYDGTTPLKHAQQRGFREIENLLRSVQAQ